MTYFGCNVSCSKFDKFFHHNFYIMNNLKHFDLMTCPAYPKKLMSTLGPSPTSNANDIYLEKCTEKLLRNQLSKCLFSPSQLFVVVTNWSCVIIKLRSCKLK